MEWLLDDLLNSVLHHAVQAPDKIQSALERIKTMQAQAAATPNHHHQQHPLSRLSGSGPPGHTDLVYITPRILVSSAPARAPHPTYNDVGRESPSTTIHWNPRVAPVSRRHEEKKDLMEATITVTEAETTTDQQIIRKDAVEETTTCQEEQLQVVDMDIGTIQADQEMEIESSSEPVTVLRTTNPQDGSEEESTSTLSTTPPQRPQQQAEQEPPVGEPSEPLVQEQQAFEENKSQEQQQLLLLQETAASSSPVDIDQESIMGVEQVGASELSSSSSQAQVHCSSPQRQHTREEAALASCSTVETQSKLAPSMVMEESSFVQEKQQRQQQQQFNGESPPIIQEEPQSIACSVTGYVLEFAHQGDLDQQVLQTKGKAHKRYTQEQHQQQHREESKSDHADQAADAQEKEPVAPMPIDGIQPATDLSTESAAPDQTADDSIEQLPVEREPSSVPADQEETTTLESHEAIDEISPDSPLSPHLDKPATGSEGEQEELSHKSLSNDDSQQTPAKDDASSLGLENDHGSSSTISSSETPAKMDETFLRSLPRGESSTLSGTNSAPPQPATKIQNSPATMATYLERRHGKHRYLAYSLEDQPPDDRTLLLFRRQIVHLQWWSPCMERSGTPSIPKLLEVCYALHAYLHLNPSNAILVYCENGKTRSAIAIACYLKFIGLVERSCEGFLHFLQQRGIAEPFSVLEQLPPSVQLFFHQFDSVLELGRFLNRKPLLLRAIALQGIPVEDKPCLDIWDSSQRHVYSSHPEMWQSPKMQRHATMNNNNNDTSQWADEEGFYKVNAVLDGDFLVLCRFGGDFVDKDANRHDPTKLLFRYTNTTGFLSGGCPYELGPHKVDLSRRYAPHLDDDDFLVTLLFEAHWERCIDEEQDDAGGSKHMVSKQVVQKLATPSVSCGNVVWRSHEPEACEQGWKIIEQRHMARPNDLDVLDFRNTLAFSSRQKRMEDHWISLALKLTNLDYQAAEVLLLESGWWVEKDATVSKIAQDEEKKNWERDEAHGTPPTTSAEYAATKTILDILDEFDVSSHFQWPDLAATGIHRIPTDAPAGGLETPKERGGHPQELESHSVPSILYPRQGDIAGLFGLNYRQQQLHSSSLSPNAPSRSARPMIPLFPRDRPARFSLPPTKRQKNDDGAYTHQHFVPPYDAQQEAVMELFLQTNHTSLSLPGLMNLVQTSRQWGSATPILADEDDTMAVEEEDKYGDTGAVRSAESTDSISRNREAKENKRKKWEDAKKAEEEEKLEQKQAHNEKRKELEVKRKEEEKNKSEESNDKPAAGEDAPLKNDPEYAKYFKMLKMGMAKEQVMHAMKRDEKDTTILDLDLNKTLKSQMPEVPKEDTPLKDDPEYSKYFKMLKMGMAKEQAGHAMKRDDKDPSILDLDPNKSLKSQVGGAQAADDGPPLKDDPEYVKYFKMLKMGMTKEQAGHAMKRDDKDPSILDLDPNKSLKSQGGGAQAADDGLPLKDDPEYAKYFKMLKMGMAKEQAGHAMKRDDKDPSILDLDPNKSLKSQVGGTQPADDGPPLKDDPEYAKYFKMLKMGMAKEQAGHAMKRDGKDSKILDLDPNKSLKSQVGGAQAADDGPPLKDDPEYTKYFKMLTMGLPIGAVKNAVSRDGKDPSIMDLEPNKSIKSQLGGGSEEKDTGPPLKEDPEYAKYFKMLTMGLPKGAVKNAISRDGKDPVIMDLDPAKSLKSQLGGVSAEEKDTGIPLKDDPEYKKYFKMLGMGLPADAVKNAIERDGKNPVVLDLDPNKSVTFQMKKKGGANKTPVKKKKRVRRKKIYWNPVDPGKLKEDSMWSIMRGSIIMDKLNYDVKEFEDLFTESADPADQKKKPEKKAAKKSIQVIDGKRSMNGGIILARLKMDYNRTAEIVEKLEHGKFDSTQLKALKEYLPDAEERRGLVAYMKRGEKSEEEKAKVYADLSETEKYMVTMMEVKDAAAKFDALQFRTTFKSRFEDITSAIRTLNSACDEVRTSERLRKLMAIILTVVNQINTGGEGNVALGFSLDALLKLNEAKAFDRKTSVLHYLVKLVKKNDESLLRFDTDLASILAAESVLLDGVQQEVNAIGVELVGVHVTAKAEAERLEQAGELRPMSLADLAEQRTAVRQTGPTMHFNKVDHYTGRTSMERFVLNAKVASEQANESIENVKKKYEVVLGYFGEDEKMASSDFFGTLRRFVAEFKKAAEQVEAIEKATAKEKKRAAARAAKAAKGKGPDTSSAKRGEAPAREVGARGIGAMAAAAAAAARKKNDAVPPGGNGVLASAAASNTNNAFAGGTKDEPMKGSANPDPVLAAIPLQRRGSNRGIGDSESKTASMTPNERKTWDSERYNSKGEGVATGVKSPFGVMASNYRLKKDGGDDGARPKEKDPDAGKSEFAVAAARLKKSHSDTEQVVQRSVYAKKVGAKDVRSSVKKVGAKEDRSAGGRSSFSSSAAAYRRKKSKRNFDVEDLESDEEEQLAKWMKPKEHADAQDIHFKSAEAAREPTKAVEPATKKASEDGNEIEQSATPPVEESKPASISEEVKANVGADIKDDGADNKSHSKFAADSTEINVEEDAEIEKNDNEASEERIKSTADSAESKPIDDADIKGDGAFPAEPTNIDVSAHVGPKEDADSLDDHTTNEVQKEIDVDSSSVIEPSLEESEFTSPQAEVAAKSSPVLPPVSDNALVEERGQAAASALVESHQASAKPPAEEANQTDTAAETGPADAAPSSSPAPPISPLGSPYFRPNVETRTAQEESKASPSAVDYHTSPQPVELLVGFNTTPTQTGKNSISLEEPKASPSASDYHTSPQPVDLLVGFNTTPTETGKKKINIGLSDFFSRQNDERKVGTSPSGGRKSLDAIVGGFLAKSARSFDKDCGLDDDDDNEDDDSIDSSAPGIRSEMLRNNFDDSSVAQMAGTLERQPMSSRLSETWTKGDTIQNWSGWANQVITASDTESVAGFEVSMDLRDEDDFDDESTIATFIEDNTIASATPGRYNNSLYGDATQTPGRVGQSISFEMPAVTPAKVAASILFSDSPDTSVDMSTPQTANVHKGGRGTAEIVLDAGLAFPANDIGQDTGLSFGGGHDLDCDDGLGFGGAGELSAFGGPPVQDEKSADNKKKWFPW